MYSANRFRIEAYPADEPRGMGREMLPDAEKALEQFVDLIGPRNARFIQHVSAPCLCLNLGARVAPSPQTAGFIEMMRERLPGLRRLGVPPRTTGRLLVLLARFEAAGSGRSKSYLAQLDGLLKTIKSLGDIVFKMDELPDWQPPTHKDLDLRAEMHALGWTVETEDTP